MDKRRKPHSYQYSAKKSKQNFLDIGQKGFLCSCNFREKECIRESYNILNKYADILYPEKTVDKVDCDKLVDAKDDVLDSLADEINQLKSSSSSPSARRFNAVQTGVKNILFITTTVDDPVELAIKLIEDISETKSQQTRYLIRLVPIEVICKAALTSIVDSFKPLVEKHFKGETTTFSIAFNHRYNNDVPKDAVIKSLADLISGANSEHKVNLTQPKLTVIVEIIKGHALLSVAPDYFKYKKYNLLSVSEDTADKKDANPAEEDSKENGGKADTSNEEKVIEDKPGEDKVKNTGDDIENVKVVEKTSSEEDQTM